MTQNVKNMLELIRSGEYKKHRVNNENYDLTKEMKGVSSKMAHAVLLEDMLKSETPYFLEGDIFGFNRRKTNCPVYLRPNGTYFTNGSGNITPNYRRIIQKGLTRSLRSLTYILKALTEKSLSFIGQSRDR